MIDFGNISLIISKRMVIFIWNRIIYGKPYWLLLRIAGRKTISQMTLAETVIMIGIGSLLIQPVAGKDIRITIMVGGVLVGTLVVMEFIQMKCDTFENRKITE